MGREGQARRHGLFVSRRGEGMVTSVTPFHSSRLSAAYAPRRITVTSKPCDATRGNSCSQCVSTPPIMRGMPLVPVTATRGRRSVCRVFSSMCFGRLRLLYCAIARASGRRPVIRPSDVRAPPATWPKGRCSPPWRSSRRWKGGRAVPWSPCRRGSRGTLSAHTSSSFRPAAI